MRWCPLQPLPVTARRPLDHARNGPRIPETAGQPRLSRKLNSPRLWVRLERAIDELSGTIPASQLRALLIIDDSRGPTAETARRHEFLRVLKKVAAACPGMQRHSALTHAAEEGASASTLLAYSGHTSVRSLARYARVSAEALGSWQAQRDLACRRWQHPRPALRPRRLGGSPRDLQDATATPTRRVPTASAFQAGPLTCHAQPPGRAEPGWLAASSRGSSVACPNRKEG
jgi:transposase